jgi:hypothetical protein
MWDNLGKHLRAGLVLSIIMVLCAAAASFTLSFLALREVAGNHVTGWNATAWVFPVCIDAGLIACEITLLTLSMMSGTGLQQLAAAFFMLVFGGFTVYFNTVRVPPAWRLVTAAPPVTGIILTIMFATLLKAFAKHTGTAWRQQGAPQAYHQLGAPGAPIQGYAWRPDASMPTMPPQWAPYGHLGSPATSTNRHSGGELGGAEGAPVGQLEGDVTKRALVRMYLSGLTPQQLQIATGSSIVDALAGEGATVSGREANRELDTYRSEQQALTKATRNGRKR